LYIVCGNGTKLTEMENSRVPRVWDEDQILPRTYGRGFMKGVPAPGGYINKMDPEGKNWELIANGFRNEFDAAFNLSGELFTYDADMEWDMNTPWYRPTRVCHVVSGAEFGWRNGSGKWPAYYPDSVPAVVNVGPGSPTGITFGYGAKFPAKFQNSLFISDWSYGVLYAVDMKSEGASYQGSLTKFITGTPLPLTDVIINPHDGAMYFAIGGRRTKSGLYRVTYTGTESTEPVKPNAVGSEARKLRKTLEAFHGHQDEKAVAVAWPHLSSADRFIRWAARIAIEHQPVETWQDRALSEENPQALLEAIIALTRHGDKLLQPKILKSLQRIQWDQLNHHQKISLVRAYSLTFTRMGTPTDAAAKSVIGQLDPHFPADSRELNNELCQLMVYLQSDTAAAKSVALLSESPTQEEQIAFAKSIRHLKTGWTPELRKEYFSWFVKAAGYRGGASFGLFVQHIKADAVANLSDEEKTALKPILEAKPKNTGPIINPIQRPFVKKWTMEELVPLVTNGLKGRDFNKGRKLFAAANCFACHRFDNEGGAIGPDLTILSRRFTSRDILESVIEPSKVISDQYAAVSILTTDGKQINGRIVNLAGDSLQINTNMLDPNAQVGVDRKMIDEMFPSKTSMMPQGLMDTLKREEVLDLMAYLLSRGNRNHEMFKK
jgi:putative heme-binding domain-containing protein